MKEHCEPAASIIASFDDLDERSGVGRRESGATVMAGGLGLPYSTVNRWRLPREKHGTGGKIPWKYRGKIRRLAQNYGVEVGEFD